MIGVLSIQGDVIEHLSTLNKLRQKTRKVRHPKDLEGLRGLIIPGGESTTLLKLLKEFKTYDEIIKRKDKLCFFGTCAGAILLAKNIIGGDQQSLGLIDIDIKRNAYGRQLDSFTKTLSFDGKEFDATFIRAPVIKKVNKAKVLIKDKTPVLVRNDNVLVSTFHPELETTLIHRYFIGMCKQKFYN